MTRYPVLLLLTLCYFACDPTQPDVQEAACQDGTAADQLNCRVAYADWVVRSVTSEPERPRGAGKFTNNWLEFTPEECFGAVLDLGAFAPDGPGNQLTRYRLTNVAADCATDYRELRTDDNLQRAEVQVDRNISRAFYGVDPGKDTTFTDVWYDITIDPAVSVTYRVDKTLDGVDYQLEVLLERVPE